MTVNLNASDTSISDAAREQNSFSFSTPTEDAVTVNIGSYVSASSTFTLNDAGSLSVTVDDTSSFNGTINAQGATTIGYSGGASLQAQLSVQQQQQLAFQPVPQMELIFVLQV